MYYFSGLQRLESLAIYLVFLMMAGGKLMGQIPSTNVVVFDLEMQRNQFILTNRLDVTQNEGYNNQPLFESNTSLLFSTNRDGEQTEIYRYDFLNEAVERLTHTEESEYSPTIIPGTNDFSVVRVEADDSTQRLWKFRSDGQNPSLMMENVKRIGYHAWIDYSHLALFVLGKEFTLQIVDVKTQTAETVAEKIGRCILKIPGEDAVSFVDKRDSLQWVLRKYNLRDQNIAKIANLKPGMEDYFWSASGFVLAGHEGKLYLLRPGKKTGWVEMADLNKQGCGRFYRLALSPDNLKLAVVVFSGEKP